MRNTGYQYLLAVHGKTIVDNGPAKPVTYTITPEPLCYFSGKTRGDAVKSLCRSQEYGKWRIHYWEYCEKDGTTII